MVRRTIVRAAFAGLIVLQIVLLAALLAFVSNYWSSRVLIALAFAGLPLAGAGNYFLFHSLTRAESVGIEAEEWLKQRRSTNPLQPKKRGRIRRLALWMPTATVVLLCLFFSFFDGAWALASHVFHPHSGRLIGYQVSIPLSWTICCSYYPSGDVDRSVVTAQRYRGLLRAGSGLYLGRNPPFSISTMSFRRMPAGDPLAREPATEIISTRTLQFGERPVTCWEEVPSPWMRSGRYIGCSTLQGDFSANFSGDDKDAAEFYRTLEAIKPTK